MFQRDKAWVILNQLLDRYEASKAFVEDSRTTRPIQLRMTDQVVSGYLSGGLDPDEQRLLHAQLKDWETDGIVALKWVKHEEDNLLERVYLDWDGISRAYETLGRTSLKVQLDDLLAELADWEPKLDAPWMSRWLDDVRAQLMTHRRVPTSLIPAEGDRRKLLLAALQGLVDKGDEEMTVRLFSKRYLGSSKAFEQQVQSKLLMLLRKYWWADRMERTGESPETLLEEFADDSRLLAELGIETTHEDVVFCGPLVYRADESTPPIDGRWFPLGLGMDTEMVKRMRVLEVPVQRILTIENKANYRHYIRNERNEDELVVYLAGFASPGMRAFLRQLYRHFERSATDLPAFHHWGDLDYGGILILQNLRERVWPGVQPWRMEPERMDEFLDYVEPFTAEYASKLESLLADQRYEWAHPLVRKLLETGGTLEQEAFLV